MRYPVMDHPYEVIISDLLRFEVCVSYIFSMTQLNCSIFILTFQSLSEHQFSKSFRAS